MSEAPDPAAVKALEAELAELRETRIAAQRRAAERATLTAALDRVSRDRSTQSSPSIEQVRDRVQGLYDELTDSWHRCDRLRVLSSRLLRKASHAADHRPLQAALDAEQHGRETLVRRAADAGLDLHRLDAAATHPRTEPSAPAVEDGIR